MVVIMDNTSFYKSVKIMDLIESDDAELLYLPKYYPDLNPIEKCWRPLKIQIQKARKFCKNFDEIMTYIFCKNMGPKICKISIIKSLKEIFKPKTISTTQ